ncbi:MAG: hypothetical protein ACTSXJ_10960 [Candidatus Baldrarchaeia archaeon]
MEKARRLYDTSAIIELTRRGTRRLDGYTTILNVIEYPPALNTGLIVIYPKRSDYDRALLLQLKLRKRGKPIPAVDLVVAAVALNRNLTLVSSNTHFSWVKEIEPDFSFMPLDET